jgi:hypothetical protein
MDGPPPALDWRDMFKRYLLCVWRAEDMTYLASRHWSLEEWTAISQVKLEADLVTELLDDLAD